MPTLHPQEPLFTDRQESILRALGTARETKPHIDLAAFVRFDTSKVVAYVSDCDRDGNLYGVVVEQGARPRVGHFSRSELQQLKRSGKLYRGDLENGITVAELARIAHMRAREAA